MIPDAELAAMRSKYAWWDRDMKLCLDEIDRLKEENEFYAAMKEGVAICVADLEAVIARSQRYVSDANEEINRLRAIIADARQQVAEMVDAEKQTDPYMAVALGRNHRVAFLVKLAQTLAATEGTG